MYKKRLTLNREKNNRLNSDRNNPVDGHRIIGLLHFSFFIFLFLFYLILNSRSQAEPVSDESITRNMPGSTREEDRPSAYGLDLTSEEQAWLNNNSNRLILYFDSSFPPIEYKSASGIFTGLGSDIIRRIEEILRFKFIIKPSDNWDRHLMALKTGECAVAPTIVKTPEREEYVFFTRSYITVPVVLISPKSVSGYLSLKELTGKKIGAVSGYASQRYLEDQILFNKFEVVPVSNVSDGLQKLSLGQIDVFAENIASAAYYIEKNGILNLKVAGKTDFLFDLSIGVSRKYPLLYSSIQKALDSIPENELGQIRKKWIPLDVDIGMNPQTILLLRLTGIFTGLLLLSLLSISLFLKHRLNQRMTELKRNEEFTKRIYESSHLPIIVMDAVTYQYLDCNPAAVKLYGFESKEQVLGKRPVDVSVPVQEDGISSEEKALYYINQAKSKGSVVFEWRHQRPDGKIWDAEVQLLSFYIEGKLFFQFSLIDITARKHAEQVLRAERQYLKDLIDFLPDATFVTDIDHRVVAWNRAAESMTGVKREEVLGRGDYVYALALYGERRPILIDLVDMKNEEIEKSYKYIRRIGTVIHAEAFIPHLNGGKGMHLWGAATPLKDQTEKRIGAIEVVRDISERKKAEDELLMFKESLENSTDAIGMATPEGRHCYQNKAFTELFGIIGENPPENLYLDQSVGKEVFRVIMSGGVWSGEVKMYSRDKKILDILLRAYANKDSEGHITALVGIHTDMTQHKKVEEEQGMLKAQLTQAQKMEAVGRLAGGVAHDFNNMLGVILGQTEMALSRLDSVHPLYENLEEIRKAAERSAELTRQLLAFARKQTVTPRIIDLNKTVEGMLKMLKRLIGEDIDLSFIQGDKVKPIRIDPSQIDQILANLCVNARDAIQEGGKIVIETGLKFFDEVYCSQHAGVVPGEYMVLAVKDNGCGMSPEIQSRLFEPFFTTKEMGKGTGLGLAMVYGIVRQNNGFINVSSESGKGTEFRIFLPSQDNEKIFTPEKGGINASEGHETILLVEDEALILRMATEMLKRLGYTVLKAHTPEEGIRLAREHGGKIHLLMTDVIMPGMNGRDLARAILSFYPELKILFMSGYTANVIADQGMLDEKVNFIQKPFSMKDLSEKLRNVLEPFQK